MDTNITVICPQEQISSAQSTSEDAQGMFTALFKDADNKVFGVSTGAIYNSTLNALVEANIPGIIFRFPNNQLQGLTMLNPEE